MPLSLVVWDFDWSMINENTDTYIFEQLAPALADQMGKLGKTEEFAGRCVKTSIEPSARLSCCCTPLSL